MRLVYRGNARQRRNAESIKSHWLFRQFSGFFHFCRARGAKNKASVSSFLTPASSRSCHSHKLALTFCNPQKHPSNKENRKHTKWKWAWFSMQSRVRGIFFLIQASRENRLKLSWCWLCRTFSYGYTIISSGGKHTNVVYPSIRSIGRMSQTDPLTQPSRSFASFMIFHHRT